MVDPTSEHVEDVSEEDAPVCSTCGDAIINESTHRVVTWVQDSTAETRHFCDDACHEDWGGRP